MNKELEKISGKVKAMVLHVYETAPAELTENVLYYFHVSCDLGDGLTADPGDTLVWKEDGWKQWEGDLTSPLDDLIDRSL